MRSPLRLTVGDLGTRLNMKCLLAKNNAIIQTFFAHIVHSQEIMIRGQDYFLVTLYYEITAVLRPIFITLFFIRTLRLRLTKI